MTLDDKQLEHLKRSEFFVRLQSDMDVTLGGIRMEPGVIREAEPRIVRTVWEPRCAYCGTNPGGWKCQNCGAAQ